MSDPSEQSIHVHCFHYLHSPLFLRQLVLLLTPKPIRLPRWPSLHFPTSPISHQVRYFSEISDSFIPLARCRHILPSVWLRTAHL